MTYLSFQVRGGGIRVFFETQALVLISLCFLSRPDQAFQKFRRQEKKFHPLACHFESLEKVQSEGLGSIR